MRPATLPTTAMATVAPSGTYTLASTSSQASSLSSASNKSFEAPKKIIVLPSSNRPVDQNRITIIRSPQGPQSDAPNQQLVSDCSLRPRMKWINHQLKPFFVQQVTIQNSIKTEEGSSSPATLFYVIPKQMNSSPRAPNKDPSVPLVLNASGKPVLSTHQVTQLFCRLAWVLLININNILLLIS